MKNLNLVSFVLQCRKVPIIVCVFFLCVVDITHPVTWWGASCSCLHPVLKEVWASPFEMWERWWTRKEMEQIHATHQPEENLIYYLQSWLVETFGVWMVTAGPEGQMCSVSSENLCEVWRKNHNENPHKNKKASRCCIKQTTTCSHCNLHSASGVCVCVCVCVCFTLGILLTHYCSYLGTNFF